MRLSGATGTLATHVRLTPCSAPASPPVRQAACEGFRGLVSTADLDRFERLHEALLGVDLGSVAGRGSTAGGGSGSGAGAVVGRLSARKRLYTCFK